MDRRAFLTLSSTALIARSLGQTSTAALHSTLQIQTVRGPIPAGALGLTLAHEHLLVDFVGAETVSRDRYHSNDVIAVALPPLRQVHALGVRSLFECTPAYLARDPHLLIKLSEASGVHLITNTGLYGARQNLFLPRYAHSESATQLAARWISEARDGIEGTTCRPGFIKCGVDPDPELSTVHRKLVEAAAETHRATGLSIAIHTGRGPGLQILDVLASQGVAGNAFLWVHAQGAPDDALFAAADQGAWLSIDGLNTHSLTRHLHLCREMKKRGQLSQVLLSHDAGWYDPGKPNGGTFRPFTLLFETFLPLLQKEGFTSGEIETLLIKNPALAYGRRPRLLASR